MGRSFLLFCLLMGQIIWCIPALSEENSHKPNEQKDKPGEQGEQGEQEQSTPQTPDQKKFNKAMDGILGKETKKQGFGQSPTGT